MTWLYILLQDAYFSVTRMQWNFTNLVALGSSPFNPSVRFYRATHGLIIFLTNQRIRQASLSSADTLKSLEAEMAELRRKLEDGIHSPPSKMCWMVRVKELCFFFWIPVKFESMDVFGKKPELLLIHRVASLVHFTHTCHCIQIILWHHFSSICKFLMGNPL